LIKILEKISEGNQPLCLILAPTRELTLQIEDTVSLLSKKARIISLIGGESKMDQGMEMNNKGCDIIVATPGRLMDCIESGYFSLDRCVFYILDEDDRITDEFEEEVVTILNMSKKKPKKQ